MSTNWLQRDFLENPIASYLILLSALLAAYVGYLLCMKILESRWLQQATSDQKEFYESVMKLARNPLKLILVTGVTWLGVGIFNIPAEAEQVIQNLLLALVALTVSYVLLKLTDVLIAYLRPKVAHTGSRLDDQLLPILSKTLKAFIVVVTLLLVIQNWGYNITSLLAGLGLGGLAVALAAQQSLSNVFGAIAILIDRPFQAGDIVNVEGVSGTVESIGFRSTRLRTFDGTLVIFPNSLLANVKVDNWQARPTRRTNFTIGVTYNTGYEKLQQAVQILRDVMNDHPGTAQCRAFFNSYGDYALNILVHHWCKYLDYDEYSRCLEEMNFEIKRRFEEAEIEFAFPTQTLYLRSEEASRGLGALANTSGRLNESSN